MADGEARIVHSLGKARAHAWRHRPEERRMLDCKSDVGRDQCTQARRRVSSRAREDCGLHGIEPGATGLADRCDQRRFAREVVVRRRLTDAGASRRLAQTHTRRSMLGQKLRRGSDQRFPQGAVMISLLDLDDDKILRR